MDNLEKLDIENNQQSKTASLMKTLGYRGSSTIDGSTENDQETVLSKPAISILSIQLTAIQNSFSELKTYNNNISKINKEVIRAQQEATKEKNIEKGGGSTAAPMESPSDGITALFPSLSKALKELSKTFEEFNQTNSQNQMSSNTKNIGGGSLGGGRRMPSAKLLAGGAAAVGVGALGYSMFSSDSAQAAEPKPPTIEPTISPTTKPEQPVVEKALQPEALQPVVEKAPEPEAVQPVVEDAPELKAPKAEPPVKKASGSEKKPVKETEDTNLTKKVENLAKRPVSVTRTEAPTVIKTDYADKVASFINGSYKVAQERVSSISSGSGSFGGGGASGDFGGDEGSSGSYTASGGMKGLLDLIASGEGDYNSMNQGGANQGSIKGSTHNASKILGKNLPNMTIGEVKRFQSLPQSHPQRLFAAGRYQIIPSTMQEAVKGTGIPNNVLFDSKTQDKLGSYLITKKRPAVGKYISGTSGNVNNAIDQLAMEFASMPRSSDGRSFYPPHKQVPHRVEHVKAALNAARTGKDVTVGSSFASGSQSRVTEYASGAVQGMTSQQGQMQLGSMGIRGSNGNLQASQLASLTAPGTRGHRAAPPAAAGMSALIVAAARQGIKIGVTDSYRSFASQVAVRKLKPGLAAKPGTSNHGWGLAFDLSDAGGKLTTSSAAYKFLKTNGPKFGIYGPLAKPYEIWHWEYRGGGSTNPPVVPVTAASQIRQANQPAVQTPAGATINSAAINTPKAACVCPEPGVVGIPMGGGGANPAQYLQGMKPPKASKGGNSNTAEDYRIYFRAA